MLKIGNDVERTDASTGSKWTRRLIAAVTVVGLTVGGLALTAVPASADTAPAPGTPATVTADALPTAQMNGVAWTQVVAGNTVYVGGQFTAARPPGAAAGVNTSPRTNLMAYNLTTGALLPWNPGANAVIRSMAVSADGSTLYVAGLFTQIAGQTRYRVAAFNAATGALLPWQPSPNSGVLGVQAIGNTVWISGSFSTVGGQARTNVAALNATTGAVLPFKATVAGGYGARGLVVNPAGTKVVVAGSFTSVNGSTNPGRGLAALDATTGESLPWLSNSVIRNAGENAAIYSISSDSDSVYVTGYDFGGSKVEDDFEGAARMSWSDGSLVWMEDCHGDTYSVAASGGVVYTAGHAHYCGNIGGFPQTSPKWTFSHAVAFNKEYDGVTKITPDIYGYRSFTGQPAGSILQWFPDFEVGTFTGQSQAAWSVATSGDYVLYAGEFPSVNNRGQQGLVRFAKKPVAPAADGPRVQANNWPLSASSTRTDKVRLVWNANWDRDSENLTYEVFRQGTAAPIYTTTMKSNFWTMPGMKFTDTTVTAGQTYQYRVRVTDPDGNALTGNWTPVTVPTTNTSSDYNEDVIGDGALHYWPLGENSASVATDWAGTSSLALSNVTTGQTGPNLAQASKATGFSGNSNGATTSAVTGPDTFTVEAWFKTDSTSGGKIVGFGGNSTGDSGSYDRHVYMDGQGRVTFGVYPNTVRTVASNTGYNDNQWHHVVASLGPDGMKLWLDAKLVGTRADTTFGQSYSGYWRVGGDNIGGWPNVNNFYFTGAISDVAVYGTVLDRNTINKHWTDSGRTSTVPAAPADAYGKSVFELDPTLYWRLGEAAGGTVLDSGPQGNPGQYFGNVSTTTGALAGTVNSAKTFAPNGGDQTGVSSDATFSNPGVFSIEAWFKTTSTDGGKIIGFGDQRTGTSNNYDRHIYMSGDGRVKFGVWTGSSQVVESVPGFNNGQWHHVVGVLSPTGQRLYLDGQLVGTISNTSAQDYTGYWRVGGDTGWEGATYWAGSVDEVAIYPSALSSQAIASHYEIATEGAANVPPTAAFTSTATDLSVAFDSSASTDTDGSIVSYLWNFGDTETSTLASPTHSYGAAGTYNVTLTVTDNRGGTNSFAQTVSVTAPNQAPVAAFTSTTSGLTAHFDGTGSSDADGTIASYAWTFGDGSTSAQASPSRLYAASGIYNVTLTVTDNKGATNSITKQVEVAAPVNQAPVAAFTSSSTGLIANFNGTGSTDPDGTIASYAWTFGDGATSTVASPSRTYAAAGDYVVTLTVTDDQGATNSISKAITVTAPVNQAPVAAFTSTTSGLTASFVGTGSSDPDGTIASYAWTFGDGATASTASPSRTYAAGGTYDVTLTVTDNQGATNSITKQVTVTAPPATGNAVATDSFERTVAAGGWGSADLGGSWSFVGAASRFSVTGGAGVISLNNSTTQNANLASVSSANTTVSATFTVDKIANGQYVALVGRQVGADQYILRSRIGGDGSVILYVLRNGTAIGAGFTVPGLTVTTNTAYTLKFQVQGTGTTNLSAKMWAAAGAEPAAWQLTRTDTNAALQAPGSVGLFSWVPTSAAAYPVALRFTDFAVTDPTVAEGPNQAPVAAFTSSASGLTASFNGSTSTDADGSITSYAWNFGDGTNGTGATATRAYTAAGTYNVTLTVTDNAGATNAITKAITVAAPPANGNVLAKDTFARTTAGGWGTADIGGAWTVSPTAARFSTAPGAGVISLNNSTTLNATLAGVSSANTTVSATFTVDKIANGQYVALVGRQVGADQYILRSRIASDGSVIVYVLRNGTAIGAGFTVPGLTVTTNTAYTLKFQVAGTGTTNFGAKMWATATPEPADWQLTRTDTNAALQAPGSVGLFSYVPTAAAVFPVAVTFTDFTVTDPTIP
ncbi:PKD domain-containing protein [Microbacterium sp.]|uniref:PKD domain-containing protein n=1 Tax=Microbacterium sp. TaxID=51671 RepID=UPI003F7250EA